MNTIKRNQPPSQRAPLICAQRCARATPARSCRRAGTTLILTLGILSVISVLAITFLISARFHKQSAVTSRNRQAAETALNTALAFAMQQVEDALSYPNFTDQEMRSSQGGQRHFQRLAPVGRWFSEQYSQTNEINPQITFQYGDVLTSPTYSTNSAPVNLLTPEVLALVPAALTNSLPLQSGRMRPLRSGWIPTDSLPEGAPLDWRLQLKSSRIAYAVFNCSSTIDANVFPNKPTSAKKQRKFYSAKDAAAAFAGDGSEIGSYLQTNNVTSVTEDNHPFFHTSYDPNPNTFRHQAGDGANDILGREAFAHLRPLDLNQPNLFQAIGALPSGALPYNKFNINSITNILAQYNATSADRWYNDPTFNLQWLLPTILLTDLCRNKNIDSERLAFEQGSRLAWSIANFIDENRIPEISNFTGDQMATRVNYAVEDVPLINKISVFNVFEPELGPSSKSLSYYNVDSSLSNHYAVAVELWYPFAPNPPQYDSACYVGIYTNEADVITSTNRPATSRELQRWFDWNLAGSDQSVMEVLFKSWAGKYRQEVGAGYLSNHPLWREVTNQSDLWFTPAMTNHPSWPVADTNGTFTLLETPAYKAFYPDTYDEVTTNAVGLVSTNVYTYTTSTNYWLSMTTPLGETNDFVHGQYVFEHNYMEIRWRNPQTGAQTNTLMSGILDENNDFVPLDYESNQVNHLLFGATPEENYFIYENAQTGDPGTNFIAGMYLSPEVDPPAFTLYTNFFNQSEITRVQPLRMPDEFAESLNGLITLLPTNNINSFYDFLMLKPDEFSAADWDDLFAYFQDTPSMQNTVLPRMQEPSLGNLSEKDKYLLYPEGQIDFETVDFVDDALSEDNFKGYFWTVYPKQTVAFLEIEERTPVGAPEGSEETEIVTNCYQIGAYMKGNNTPNTIWLRPVVTVIGPDIAPQSAEGQDAPLEVDRIVDEALLLGEEKVQGWIAVTNLYIPEPRDNAYAASWRSFSQDWDSQNNQTNLSHGVRELPFIHFNGPLQSIGDLGHIYSEYTERYKEEETIRLQIGADGTASRPGGGRGTRAIDDAPDNTLTFATMPGASLLDFFTITPNKQQRGLIQANTTLGPTLDLILSDIQLGWTNHNQAVTVQTQTLPADMRENWRDLWSEALTNNLYNTGWRSYADMLPELATNDMQRTLASSLRSGDFHSQHNYTEDVLRGIIDKVSFRQNIFVIVLAAQTLAPGTEASENPTVLAEQRAAVTVIRDAYSGNWTIAEWRKLTQ
ncbi:MAG: hypothetical protein PHO37_14130 [Kiritimatiellae bacterium]|nr:hypothetical protein [Kiritimatiellia bacterium]